jgi:hypothetical protein
MITDPDKFIEQDPSLVFRLDEEKKMAYFLCLLSKRTLELLPACKNKETGFIKMGELFSSLNTYSNALLKRYRRCSRQVIASCEKYAADFKKKMEGRENAKNAR